ncbi:unnamed protein product [Hyaloperonospora brassicae]|uniref:Uncharacterized protein n=1 Tax=Hyaloperonospora brassicae TaxID=162125 RepID=A0AAV0TDM3_HYABA|nr:unnamed protein product [Hyaloperonospora brassicae]
MTYDDQTPSSPSLAASKKRRRRSSSYGDVPSYDHSLCAVPAMVRRKTSDARVTGQNDGGGASTELHKSVLASQRRTLAEMDTFVQGCHLWQEKLGRWTHELAARAQVVETLEVAKVVQDLVTSVETQTVQTELWTKQVELQWARWTLKDTERYVTELLEDTRGTEEFRAIEKQLQDDRVVELEMQLAQKRAVEQEKATELSLLRAGEEQLMHARGLALHEEFETLSAEKTAIQADVKRWTEKIKHQERELACVDEERRNVEEQKRKLVEEVCQVREQQQARESQVTKQNIEKANENEKLQAKLMAAETREVAMAAMLKAAEKAMEIHKQRKEELEILYTKFSSAMDAVSDKTMRLEELEQALKDLQKVVRRNEDLEKQVAQLQQENSDLSAAAHRFENDMKEKTIAVQKRLDEVKKSENQQKERASRLEAEVAELRVQNEALRKENVKHTYEGVGQPPEERSEPSTDVADDLVVQVAEKEALQMFVHRYYTAAEEKCTSLLRRVSDLELELEKSQQSQTQTE